MGPSSVFRLSAAQVERLVRQRAAESIQVRFTAHALARMKSRHILRDEVLEVLRLGTLARSPEPNVARGSLECLMQRFLTGREVGVVAAVSDDNPLVVVVTAIELD